MEFMKLPKTLNIEGEDREINSDFRPCFGIMQVFERGDLTGAEKLIAMVEILFRDDVPPELLDEAINKAWWFLDCGKFTEHKQAYEHGKLYSWEQDEAFIISAVDRTTGISCRSIEYLHWWDFMAALMECKECTFSTLIHQRKLRRQGKQNKWDKEWWAENRSIAELKNKITLTQEEQTKLNEFNKLLG